MQKIFFWKLFFCIQRLTVEKKYGEISIIFLSPSKNASHTNFIYKNCMITVFFPRKKKKHSFFSFRHQTVLFDSNSRRNYFESFFTDLLKVYEIFMATIFQYI